MPALTYLGRISYSLYLFHPIVLLAMLHGFAGRMPLGWLLLSVFGLTFVVSDLAYRVIERPAVNLSRVAGDRVGRIYGALGRRWGRSDHDV